MELQADLERILHPSRVLMSPIYRIAYANDASYFRLVPEAVVQPASIGEIQSLFQFSQQHKIPMTFRAAGTSLSGQAVTDGILVDISKHWGRYNLEEDAALIRAQPGIIGGLLNTVLKSRGRRIGPDPASIDACMVGGILANNSSGMCCGVTENAYRTLHSMTFVLPDGFTLNTSDPAAAQLFENEQPHIAKGLLELKQRITRNSQLATRIRRRYQAKNNNGYLLNAFLDFDSPLDILTHLLIGSEGTLGFIAEAVLHTLPDFPHKCTGQLYFKDIQDAASAIDPLRQSGARAAEIMDRASLRSVEGLTGAPAILSQLPEGAAAILVEYQAENAEAGQRFKKEAERAAREIRLLYDPEFTDDPIAQAALWKLRKGIIPTVGAMRPPATTLLTEDVVFPVPSLAEGVTDIQHLFDKHGYPEGVIFGHAKDGNLHFLIAQSFNTDADVRHFAAFMDDLVSVVSGKYDGALKAEHGTGRNTAPFVATEWGDEAYAIMRDLKSLLDPDNMLSPGVVINPNPQAHVTDVKSMALAAAEVDKCIECGFCESKCPSRRLTLTPRQRIVVQREIACLRASAPDSPRLDSLVRDFSYHGIDTCVLDGLCATACPITINTGDLTRRLRAESVTNESPALWVANHFALAEDAVGWAVRFGHAADNLCGTSWHFVLHAAEKITGSNLPKWNQHIPSPTKNLRALHALRSETDVIYFPSCVSRQLGTPPDARQPSPAPRPLSLATVFAIVASRADISLNIPPDAAGHCCGQPFHSKGYESAYRATLHKTIRRFWEWSEHGNIPIVIDTTSCTHALRTCGDGLSVEDRELWKQLTILDSIEFLHDFVLPKLDLHPMEEDIILHPNCSARKLGLDSKMLAIANRCARSAIVPLNLGCCAFAGDRGLLFPELTASATQAEAAEVTAREYGGYYSSNIPCEIGMSEATGKDYLSIVYLVEKTSR